MHKKNSYQSSFPCVFYRYDNTSYIFFYIIKKNH